MRHYNRLTQAERYQIQALLGSAISISEIAKALNRSYSTISREIKRNKTTRGYVAETANTRALEKRKSIGPKMKIQGELKDYIVSKLEKQWSPEQISGRLKLEGQAGVCHETIYKFIYSDYADRGGLWKHMRRKRCRRITRENAKKNNYIGIRTQRKWVDERPTIIDSRSRLGDIEVDTIEGKRSKSVLLTMVDRASHLTRIVWLEKKSSGLVHDSVVRTFSNLTLESLTYDNGPEFSLHDITSSTLGVDIYFCRPYQSWQRGTVENTNGLIRQYFPKRQDLEPHKVKDVEELLNNRPRKKHGFKTPYEVHDEMSRGLH